MTLLLLDRRVSVCLHELLPVPPTPPAPLPVLVRLCLGRPWSLPRILRILPHPRSTSPCAANVRDIHRATCGPRSPPSVPRAALELPDASSPSAPPAGSPALVHVPRGPPPGFPPLRRLATSHTSTRASRVSHQPPLVHRPSLLHQQHRCPPLHQQHRCPKVRLLFLQWPTSTP